MEKLQLFIAKIPYFNSIFLSLLLIIVYLISLQVTLMRLKKNEEFDFSEKVQMVKRIKSYGRLILVVGVFFLWFAKLQTVFISLLAVAAAIVIALKEIIMCITGGLLIRTNKYFKLGDRIHVDEVGGYVIEKSLTVTKVLEIGPEKNSQQTTGNIIAIPNSIFLSESLVNESYFQDFSIKSFTFLPWSKELIEESEQHLLKLGHSISADYLSQAKNSISNYCQKEGIAIPSVEPRVKLAMNETGDVKLILKIPVNNKCISDIEQKLIKGYLIGAKENNGKLKE